jgi:hypothetical protein
MTPETLKIIVFTLGTVLAGLILLFLIVARFNLRRILLGASAEWRVLLDKQFATQVAALMKKTAPAKEEKAKPSGEPLRLLALLQREGRLVDFLLENIQAYDDAQVGAAVRDIHQKCQAALAEHVVLQPVLAKNEGDVVEVPSGFDPSAIQLTGNVTGVPPFKGTLQHHGWRVQELKLAPPPSGQDEWVLTPAVVEMS